MQTYRIKAILEALTTRYVHIVLLQARKAFALEQFPVHTQSSPLRKLADVILEVKRPATDERRDRGVCDREVVPNCELPV
jgi:hypothetical protein